MKKHGYKRRVLSKRRRSRFSASIWAPILKLAGCIAGVLAALGILTLLIMIVLEGVFKIDTPLRPDGFFGKAARLVKIELPLIESPTPYIPPEPTPTPHPMDLFIGEDEEKEIECSPCIVDGRTLVPVRALAEPLGLIVGWDEQTRTITIDYPKFQKSSDVREYIENNFYNGYYYMTERTDGLTTEQYRNTVSIISVSVSWSSPEKIYIRLNVPFADVPHEGDKAFSTAKEFMVLLYTELAPRLPKGTEIKSCEFYGYYFKYPHIHEELRTSTGCEWYTENGQMMWY